MSETGTGLKLPVHDECGICDGDGDVPNPIFHPEDALDGPYMACPACYPRGWNFGPTMHPRRVLYATGALPLSEGGR